MQAPEATGRQEASSSPRRFDRLLMACAAAGIAGVLLLARWLHADPRGFGTHEQLGFPPCLTRHYLDIPCPFCGMTTAFALMAHGRFVDAFLTQPAGAAAFVVALATCIVLIVMLVTGRTFSRDFTGVFLAKASRYALIPLVLAWIYKIVATFCGFP